MENNENEKKFQAAEPPRKRDTGEGGSKNSARGQNKSRTPNYVDDPGNSHDQGG